MPRTVDFARSGAGRFKDYRIEIAIASRAVTFCPFLVKRFFFGETAVCPYEAAALLLFLTATLFIQY